MNSVNILNTVNGNINGHGVGASVADNAPRLTRANREDAAAAIQRQSQLEPSVAEAGSMTDGRLRTEDEVITNAAIELSINEANELLAKTNFRLQYEVHEDTSRIMVRVYDIASDEVIREIPPESRLEVISRILELTGIVYDGNI